MSTTLLFLHGVGQRDDVGWRISLDGALQDLQHPSTAEVAVAVPS